MGRGGAQLGKAVKGKNRDSGGDEAAKAGEQQPPAAPELSAKAAADLKALQEYERAAKAAEANRLRLQALQQQEALNTRINELKVRHLHRQLMRTLKVDSLRKDAELLVQTHQRDVSRRDRIIEQLVAELDELEEHFLWAQRSHMERVSRATAMMQMQVNEAEAEFECNLRQLKEEFENERLQLVTQHGHDVKRLKGVIAAVEEEERKKQENAKQAHDTEREEITNKSLEDINMLRINLENKIEDLAKQFDSAHQQYVDHTDQANRQFKKLVRKDKELNKQIETQRLRIERCQAKLASWKKTIAQNERECRARNDALRAQKDAVAAHCHQLKARMRRLRAGASKRIADLTLLSRDALQRNQAQLATAEKILRLAELARQLETERERVQPFAEDAKGANAGERKAAAAGDEPGSFAGDVAGAVAQHAAQLEGFFQRLNRAQLDRLALEDEKQRLQQENGDLRELLRQFLDGITVQPTSLDHSNTLVIVNGRVNMVQPEEARVKRLAPATVVEGSIAVRQYAAHARAVV
jgi:hypothetical protein